ncbi:hypothetical protein ACWDOR_40165 [Streptosporangium canum]
MAFTYAAVAWPAEDDELGDLWCLTFVRGVSQALTQRPERTFAFEPP